MAHVPKDIIVKISYWVEQLHLFHARYIIHNYYSLWHEQYSLVGCH